MWKNTLEHSTHETKQLWLSMLKLHKIKIVKNSRMGGGGVIEALALAKSLLAVGGATIGRVTFLFQLLLLYCCMTTGV